MTKDQKMAAFSGITAAVAVSMAFYGGDWLALYRLLRPHGERPGSETVQMLIPEDGSSPGSGPLEFEKEAPQVCTSPAGTAFSSPSSGNQAPSRPAAAVSHSPLPSKNPEVTARPPDFPVRNHGRKTELQSQISDARNHSFPVIQSTLQRKGFIPYFYQNGALVGRIQQDSPEELPAVSSGGDYRLHQTFGHQGKNLQISLTLDVPPEEDPGKTAVIFSQEIPDGWNFLSNQGCRGWHVEQNRILKFLASPENPGQPLAVSLLFAPQNCGAAPPRIARATCAIQRTDGNRKLYHAK